MGIIQFSLSFSTLIPRPLNLDDPPPSALPYIFNRFLSLSLSLETGVVGTGRATTARFPNLNRTPDRFRLAWNETFARKKARRERCAKKGNVAGRGEEGAGGRDAWRKKRKNRGEERRGA